MNGNKFDNEIVKNILRLVDEGYLAMSVDENGEFIFFNTEKGLKYLKDRNDEKETKKE